jgi:hypothetical protein
MTLVPTVPTPDAAAASGVVVAPECVCLLSPNAEGIWETMIGSMQIEQFPKSCSGASESGIGRG